MIFSKYKGCIFIIIVILYKLIFRWQTYNLLALTLTILIVNLHVFNQRKNGKIPFTKNIRY